jgi:hypothetical protein
MPISSMDLVRQAWIELDWSAEVDNPKFQLSLNKNKMSAVNYLYINKDSKIISRTL